MRSLLIVDMGAVWGGQEIYSRSIAQALVQKGWSVSCLSPHAQHAVKGVHVEQCAIGYRDFLAVAHQVKTCARTHDIVHFNGIRAIYLSALMRLAIPTVGTKHLPYSNPGAPPLRSAVARAMAPVALRGLDWLIAISDLTLSELPKSIQKKSGVILNGVADLGADQFAAENDLRPLRICFVGRFVPHKGLMRLLEAVRLLRDRHVSVDLTVAGTGPLEAEARTFVQTHMLGAQVHFLGYVSTPGDIYLNSHVCVLPSLYEGLPLSLLEAMSASCALVAHDIAGVRDVVREGRNGFLVEPNPASLANAIERLAVDRPLLGALRRSARDDYLQRWQLARMIDETEAVYLRLLEDRRHLQGTKACR